MSVIKRYAVQEFDRRVLRQIVKQPLSQNSCFRTVNDNQMTVVLDTNLTPELIEEGFVRELISKIQTMRKEAGFEVMDKIIVYAKDNDKLKGIMEGNKADIIRDVMADDIKFDTLEGYEKEWDINGEKVILAVKKI